MWWGYLHTSGTIQAKRYFSEDDISEALESPFVQEIVYPFEADGRDEALQHIKAQVKPETLGNLTDSE
jgi:hypothetical protein